MARLYPKVYRTDNYNSREGGEFPNNEPLIIQEKLDGSNVTIEFIKGEKEPKIHSRTTQINKENPGNWQSLVDWVKNHTQFKTTPFDKSFRLHGEWLMQAKLPYNKTHKNTFWLFDVAVLNDETSEYEMRPFVSVFETAHLYGLNLIPFLEKEITLIDFIKDENWKNFVVKQPTLLPDSSSVREGIVLKTRDGKKRMKFVSPYFKESMGQGKEKGIPLFTINGELITEARTQKYIHKLKEENILPLHIDYSDGPTIGTIFKNQGKLVDDFMEEEFEEFLKIVKKQVKKNVGRTIKYYIEKQKELAINSIIKKGDE